MPNIDLNCDMGESFAAYKLGRDGDVIKYISSANIACGWHAGDALVMNRSVQLAAAHGVVWGPIQVIRISWDSGDATWTAPRRKSATT